nr:CshA/CshB family fibrillar adhesin-related protein [uncultured Cellulosilyticum sp.]
MLQVQYAATNSKGVLAPLIGWIDFGTLLSLTQHSASTTVTNAIAGGYFISFDLSLSVQGNPTAAAQVKFEGFTIPTTPCAPFGKTAYTGIPGHVALYMPTTPPSGNEITITIVLRDISVTNFRGEEVPDFFLVAADSGVTREIPNSSAETWSVTTDGSPWELVEEIPALSGFASGAPIVTGVGTKTVTETGTAATNNNISSNAFLTQCPSRLIAMATVDGSRQGFAFGVIIPDPKECHSLATIRSSHINYVNPPHHEVASLPLKSCDQLLSISYNNICYNFNGNPILISGQLGTYIFFEHYVLFNSMSNASRNTFDIFSLNILKGNDHSIKFLVFSTRPTHQRC